jgi:serpin B
MKRLVVCLVPVLLLAALPARAGVDAKSLTQGNNAFACDLYGKLRAKEGNLFFSPFSISTALAMTSAGARGDTLSQMEKTLHLPEQQKLHPALAALTKELAGDAKKRAYVLRVANALWGKTGEKFLPAFLKLTRDHYGAGFQQVDFAGDTEGARRTINAWVEKQTEGKIKDLFGKGVLKRDTRLVLANAIYFQGDWASQFKKDQTKKEDFTREDGTRVPVPLMHQEARFGYVETAEAQVLEMPYAGKQLSMVAVLPRKGTKLAEVEKGLSADKLAGWVKALRQHKVKVWLPRYQLESAFQLNQTLQALGMELAFSQQADLSGMNGKGGLYIGAVVHKAFVEVDEKGTKAAAATGVAIQPTSARIDKTASFRADRPFVFLIRDQKSGAVLFLGRVREPKV